MNKPAPISSALISVKGQATQAAAAAIAPPAPAIAPYVPMEARKDKAMSLKLDHVRYIQLKQLGLDRGKTSQDLLVEAVDLLLAKYSHG